MKYKVPNVGEQVNFRIGKNCISQVLNLTQKIEDGFETKKITGGVFIDLSGAYETINLRKLKRKVYKLTLA